MKSISLFLNGNSATSKRDNLSKEITALWRIIRTENVIEKGKMKRNHDMKGTLNRILSLSEERIESKLDSLCINMGFSSREDLPINSIFPLIYTLSEKNEQLVQLGLIPTIKPYLKEKIGKKKLSKSEEITEAFIKMKKEKLQLEINKLKKQLADFNNNVSFDISKSFKYKANLAAA